MTEASLLDGEASFRAQLRVWGYAVQGDACELGALTAEQRAPVPGLADEWDRTAADLERRLVAYGNQPFRRVKEHAALRWVMEHCLREHEPWPGL